jgi:hypothetical protein
MGGYYNMFNSLPGLRPAFALVLLLFASQLRAQQAQSPQDRVRITFENRLHSVINAMTTRANAENAELNTRLTAMNAAAPLETRKLDSADVSANVSRLIEFIDYLKHERTSSDSLTRDFEDSLYILSVELPLDIDAQSIHDLDGSFYEDRNAFNGFLDAMSKLYSDVLDVLLYLQHTSYTVDHDTFTFTAKKDQAEYLKRMKIVESDTKDLNKANEDMRKANAKANEQMKTPPADSDQN